MTIAFRSRNESDFSAWLRGHPGLDSIKNRLAITDSDFWIHQYRRPIDRIGARHVDNILLLELKTHGRDVPFAQRDTLWLIDQLRRQLCKGPGNRRRHVLCNGPRGEQRRVRWFGVHVLVLSGSSPDNSSEMFWNGQRIDQDTLVSVLRFDNDPDQITKSLEYRRHHRPTQSALSLLAALEGSHG